jgi:DNA invertase Pin-like site-specific DNA recombinase
VVVIEDVTSRLVEPLNKSVSSGATWAAGPDVDPFILHLFAALAEKERSLIATRTKAALAAAKARSRKPVK